MKDSVFTGISPEQEEQKTHELVLNKDLNVYAVMEQLDLSPFLASSSSDLSFGLFQLLILLYFCH